MIPSSLVQTVAPTETPVSLDEVKDHLRIDDDEEDLLIASYIEAATIFAQEYTWSQLCTATFAERWDRFPSVIVPKKCPLLTVTSVAYVDTAGVAQTLTVTTDYVVDIYQKPARIIPAYTKWWPATRCYVNDVTLTYTAGYGGPDDVPAEVKQAILLKCGQLYAGRGGCDPGDATEKAIRCLLDLRSFRVFY